MAIPFAYHFDSDVPVSETAVIFPCVRGPSRSARPPISSAPHSILYDIGNPSVT